MRMILRSRCILLLTIMATCALSGCVFPGSSTVTSPKATPMLLDRSPDLRGTIVEVYVEGLDVKGLYIEGKKEADTSYDRARVGVTGETRIFTKQQGEYVAVASTELRVGQVVEVLFTGPILTSDPIQANAQVIAVVK